MVVLKKINIESLIVQYLIGLALNLIFLIILLASNVSYRNLQIPEGEYSNNLWRGTDVMTYVEPARNFLDYRVFGDGHSPDYHRTIGYPLFLSVMMMLFGSRWLIAVLFVQAILFAFIYPAVSKIAVILFPNQKSIVRPVFIFSLLSGAYFATVPVILTDLFFAVLLVIGICFGLLSIINQSWKYLVLQVIFLGYAGQVRPTLIFYPIVNVFVLLSMAKRYGISGERRAKALIAVSSVLILLTCNLPSLRNYLNHGVFRPTDALESNLFNHFGKNVMTGRNDLDAYEAMRNEIEEAHDLKEILALRRKYALHIYRKYPGTTLKYYIHNAIPVMGHTHLLNVAHFWGYHWEDETLSEDITLKESNLVLAIVLIWYLINLAIYTLFLSFLIRLTGSRNFLFLFTLLIYVSYFVFPSYLTGGGSRFRLTVEWLIVIFALHEIRYCLELFKRWKTTLTETDHVTP